MTALNRLESNVNVYAHSFDTNFKRAVGSRIEASDGREFLDFFAGAGALNYGHNNGVMKAALLEYISQDGITHSLDMATEAKERFFELLESHILGPRDLAGYRVQSTGPTGTNAVEAALKLARLVTKRQNIVAFTNAYHGVSLGSLAATGNQRSRRAAGIGLTGVTFMPYDGYLGTGVDTARYLERTLDDSSSGMDLPAAVIVETLQAEGGLNAADHSWLVSLSNICQSRGILLIIDEIQVGCGRTGTFFSFEESGVRPDIIALSKSISGYGCPMSLLLFREELDVWESGGHTGTFRGNNLAFVTGAAAISEYWRDEEFSNEVTRKGRVLRAALDKIVLLYPEALTVRGRGLIQGIACPIPGMASRVSKLAFRRGLIIETCGPRDDVIKCLPPLTITHQDLREGLDILSVSFAAAIANVEAV